MTQLAFVSQGTAGIRAAFADMSGRIQRQVLRSVVSKGIRPFGREAKALAPRKGQGYATGNLRDQLITKTKTVGNVIRGRVSVSAKRINARIRKRFIREGREFDVNAVVQPARHLHLYVGGTKPHQLGKGGKGGQHPGSAPHPFVDRAFDNRKDEATRIMEDSFAVDLQRIAAKHGIKV